MTPYRESEKTPEERTSKGSGLFLHRLKRMGAAGVLLLTLVAAATFLRSDGRKMNEHWRDLVPRSTSTSTFISCVWTASTSRTATPCGSSQLRRRRVASSNRCFGASTYA